MMRLGPRGGLGPTLGPKRAKNRTNLNKMPLNRFFNTFDMWHDSGHFLQGQMDQVEVNMGFAGYFGVKYGQNRANIGQKSPDLGPIWAK